MKSNTDAGEMLVRALDLGKSQRDSLGYRAARDWSEKGMDLRTGLAWFPEYGALVGLVSRRVRGEKPKIDDARREAQGSGDVRMSAEDDGEELLLMLTEAEMDELLDGVRRSDRAPS